LTVASNYLLAQNSVGIGITSPNATLDVLRGTAPWGTATFRGSTNFSYFNFGTSEDTYIRGGKPGSHVILNDLPGLGNVGIGTSSPGFPLNFASTLGDKIALWGNSGAHYGIGIQSLVLQIHTDGPGADIAFGYGSSSLFTEKFRLKGTGGLTISGNEGQSGQVLRTNGVGQPVSWSNPLNQLYNNMTEYEEVGSTTVNPLGNANLPGLNNIVLNIATRSKVMFSTSVIVESNACFACGGSTVQVATQFYNSGGGPLKDASVEANLGFGERHTMVTGNKIVTVDPGSYILNTVLVNGNISGPSIIGSYGRTDVVIIAQ
jgi:hypothetical protein